MLRAGCIRVTHPCAGRRQVLLPAMPLDLHVLGPPLAFILSQDQTLHCKKLTGTYFRMDTKIFVHFVCCFGKRPHGRSPGFQYFQRTLSLVTNTPVSPGTSDLFYPFHRSGKIILRNGSAKVICFVYYFQIYFEVFFLNPKNIRKHKPTFLPTPSKNSPLLSNGSAKVGALSVPPNYTTHFFWKDYTKR